MAEVLLDKPELLKRLKVNPRKLRRLLKEDLPHMNLGGHILAKESELEKWLETKKLLTRKQNEKIWAKHLTEYFFDLQQMIHC